MLKTFLLAGGAGNEDFRFPLRSTKQRLDQALLDIGYKEKSGAHAHMVAEKLTFQDICRQAEDAYRTQFDRKEWPPASHAPDVRAPSATFGNVATAPAGISRAEVLTLIQSQASGTETPTKKGNCHKCGKPGHWANKCPELNRKSGSSSSSGSRQDRTNKHKSWRTIPPLPGTSNSKKVKDKTFNWCEKCRRWTVTHTTATHTGGERRPPAPAPSPRANLSMLAPDPSVWLLDFPVKPNVTSPPRSLLNLIRGANPWLLLLFPSLSVPLFLIWLLWLSILRPPSHGRPFWLGSPTIFTKFCSATQRSRSLPPFGCSSLLSVFPEVLTQPPVARRLPPLLRSRHQRRRFSRLLKKSFAPPRFNSGIRANKLHRSYPLRLRQQGYVALRPPTLAQRDDFRHFATLKERALRLQRRADKLRNSSPCSVAAYHRPKGETAKQAFVSSWCSKRSRPSPRTAKYCPVAPANSPDPFAIAPLTFHQRAAANKILSHVHLACHSTPLRMALQAPLACEKPSDPRQTRAPSFGTRAPAFPSRPTSPILKVPSRRPARSRNSRASRRVSKSKVKAKSLGLPTPLDVQSPPDLPDETITIEPNRLTLSGVPNDVNRGPVTANVNPQNNLPTSEAYNATDPFKAADALVSIVNTVHERNLNLNEAEKELLRWHYRWVTSASRRSSSSCVPASSAKRKKVADYKPPHVDLPRSQNAPPANMANNIDVQFLARRLRLLSKIERTLLKQTISSQANAFRSIILFAALVDVYLPPLEKRNSTTCIPVVASSLTTPPVYFCGASRVTPQEYLADNSKTFTSAEFSRNLAEFQQVIRFAGVGAHHHNGIAERNIRTIMAHRTMMLHSAIHWPDVADPHFGPSPLVGNKEIDGRPRLGMSSLRPRQNDLGRQEIATLDSSLNSHRQPRILRQTRQLGPSCLESSNGVHHPTVSHRLRRLVRNCPASADDLPNFNDDCWQRMFRDSTFQYVLDDEDEERLIAGSTDYEQANELLSQMQRVATALDNATPPQVLPVAPPPLSTPLPPPREQIATPPPVVVPPPPATPLLTPREATPQPPTPIAPQLPTPTPVKLFPSSPTLIRPANESDKKVSEQPIAPKATKAKSTPVKHEPRRSTRNRSAPVRLGYDGQQGHGYMAEFDGTSLEWLYNEVAEASVSDPDTLSFTKRWRIATTSKNG
ncbi:hypothetical protein MHU86_1505 [Fragilaria crotonensis]|nr:hypothetical protein MHU86_1505 [Fragilaria crotonensis]